jgi:hypothetical protein
MESFEIWCWRKMEKTSWAYRVKNEGTFHRVGKKLISYIKYKKGELT